MSARVSVVIRTKDRPSFLARALADVAAQSYGDWEIVIANDGGERDAVERVLADFGERDRVRVEDVPAPGGRCAAANLGIRLAQGDYVVLHDDDDLWDGEFLAETSQWLDSHPEHVAVTVPTAIVYEELVAGRWSEVARTPFWDGMARLSLSEMLAVNRVVPISLLYRRSVHDVVGWYDESLDAVEDWEFLLRVMPIARIGFIATRPLAFWTQRPTASGVDANSMFALASHHRTDDAAVRDRELASWVRENGIGLPLYIAGAERRIMDHIDSSFERLHATLRHEIEAHQPVASRVRRIRRWLRGER